MFLFPVHKLFDGDECLKGLNLNLKFLERHRNEKLHKIHTENLAPIAGGFDISRWPFIRESDTDASLVKLDWVDQSKSKSASVLLVPVSHPCLTRFAKQTNSQTRRREIVRFVVPCNAGDNRFADSSFQFLDPFHSERRIAPEYLNIRHEVKNPVRADRVSDLNRLRRDKFMAKINKGGYEAAHFVDDTCEGCITVEVEKLGFDKPDENNFAAYSLVCAPDFFPLVDQADVIDWVENVLKDGGEREQFAQGGPRPLSRARNCINPKLLRREPPPKIPASVVRDPENYARTETLTAIVAASKSHADGDVPAKGDRYEDPSTTFLSDAASGIFDPGWDVSFSGNGDADFFAAYGLGSPFPEDAKLCAAINSFWPSVAPDATRTFGIFPSKEWDTRAESAATAVPLMDEELGFYRLHPLVRAGKRKRSVGWDSESGPCFEMIKKKIRYVNHADIAQSDYVSHALEGSISIGRLAYIDPKEFFRRMNALRACIAVLPESPRRVSETRLFLVSASKIDDWNHDSNHDSIRKDPRLIGIGYLFQFALLNGKPTYPRNQHGRARRSIHRRYTCQIGDRGICWKLEAPGQEFVFSPVHLLYGDQREF
jgi:hypothetical protein